MVDQAGVAQQAEQLICNQKVWGSIPLTGPRREIYMRKTTIKRRMRLACLSDEAIDLLYEKMKGKSDKFVETDAGKTIWAQTVKYIFNKYEPFVREAK